MGVLYVKGVAVRDTKRKGTKFNRNEDQQCVCCKMWKPFTRRYWPTSMYIACRKCVYQLESNIAPSDKRFRIYKPRQEREPTWI